MESSSWFVVLLEILAYILLLGRLLHDSIRQKILIQQMMAYLTSASDIFELFSLFDEKQVIENSNATLYVLIFWTLSFVQFIPVWGSHNLGNRNSEHKKQKVSEKKQYLCTCDSKCLHYMFNALDDSHNEDDTERNESGFAFLFQDGPFLIVRMYLIFQFNLFTQSLVFYSLKNISLTILLLVKYKLRFLIFALGVSLVTIIFVIVVKYTG